MARLPSLEQTTPAAATSDRRPGDRGAAALSVLAGRGAFYIGLLAIQTIVGFLLIPVVTRQLDAAEYGSFSAAFVTATLVTMVGAAGLPDIAARLAFDPAGGLAPARRLLASGAVVGALVAALGAAVVQVSGLAETGVAVILGAGAWFGIVSLGAQTLLRATDRPWAFAAVALVSGVAGQLLGLSLVVMGGGWIAYLAGVVVCMGVGAALGVRLTAAFVGGFASRDDLRGALALGLPLVPHALGVYALGFVDRLIIAAVLGTAAVGRYQVAYAIGGAGVLVAVAVNQAWIPLLLGAAPGDRVRVLVRTSSVIHVLAASAAAAIALLAPYGVLIAAPSSYGTDALADIATVVAVSVLPYVTASTFLHLLYLQGATRPMAVIAPLAAAVNVVVNVVLLREVGLIAAALATVAAYGVLPPLTYIATRRVERLDMLRPVMAAAWLAPAPFVAVGLTVPADGWGAGIRGIGLIIVLLALHTTLGRLARSTRGEYAAGSAVDNPA